MKNLSSKNEIVREVQSIMFEIQAVMIVRASTPARESAWIGNACLFGNAFLKAAEATAELLSSRTRAGTHAAHYAYADLCDARDRIRDLAAHCGFGCTPSQVPSVVKDATFGRLACTNAAIDEPQVNEDRRPGATDFYAPGDVCRNPIGGAK